MVCRFFSISFQEDEKKRDCPLADVFSIPRYPGINAYCYRICRRLREIIEQTLSPEILVIEGGEGMNIFGIFRTYFTFRIKFSNSKSIFLFLIISLLEIHSLFYVIIDL